MPLIFWNSNTTSTWSITTVSPSYDLMLDDYSATNIMYIWEAAIWSTLSSASWRIKKIDETTWLVLTWAWWNSNFDKIWNDRLTLTYN